MAEYILVHMNIEINNVPSAHLIGIKYRLTQIIYISAVTAFEANITPIIIDNTNCQLFEMTRYVKAVSILGAKCSGPL